ncbi:hypothetical protein NQ315_005373 [Exocentrus adspersus]|uniref:ATP-dependent RNA helicase n=1 Tax=Exocentrus adspersus TaxID=1586481 RepID=A0AAV8W2G7_9CUCU|nr:hypothetical protein NQ315_005373 [Exocentrus adspersus]
MSKTKIDSENNAKANKKKKKVVVFTKKKSLKNSEAVIIEKLQAAYESINSNEVTKFGDFPLSSKTLKGLRECGYHKPTEIQKETIGLALQGKDILGAAQTGSGKTLAFLIPILEKLYCKQWTKLDGLGALVITPTRELAYQIFETLRKMGEHHDFSAGLIIGGKDLKFERNRMDQCNIIICTPGRLLQHMDENPLLDCVNMQMLVLDEADRCLDMGFEQTMNAIIANLPPKRQTLLFSATQTRSVKDLARLSLKDPSYISVHEHSEFSTPKELSQSYVICELQDKVSILWSFLRNHTNKKIIVFFASCKQVKYIYEIFCKLRPGISLMALYGTLHQLRRMDIYETFCKKQSAVLFATDIAARGLDFPKVHWVVQVDCPEDAATYIHRVGRTARYHRGGESLLMLLQREENMVDKLKEKKIPIEKIEINPLKLNNPVRKMEAYLAKDPTLKDTAQRAFVSYAKAVFLMKDKEIFDAQALDTNSFAKSLGLTIPPRIRFLQRLSARAAKSKSAKNEFNKDVKNNNKVYFNMDSDEDADQSQQSKTVEHNKEVLGSAEEYNSLQVSNSTPFYVSENDESDDDNVLTIKRRDHDIEPSDEQELINIDESRILYNDEGELVVIGNKEKKSELARQYENENEGGIDIEKSKMMLREEDKFDKQLFKEKVKMKHKEEKRKLKEKMKKNKKEEQERDEFGESESGEEPDLSWLPDPDKLYGENNTEGERLAQQDEKEAEQKQEANAQQVVNKSKKRKLNKKVDDLETVLKKKKKHKIKEISSSLTVNEAEQLAMLLLNNK